ncbi:hypothetical protein LPB19_08640 [Marinobacter salinisoli]|uniref:DUF4239 domain-containing protein n=1 Tax=Marinobacter salinisoli TaxID=2769486 RepID=A0ABX7MM92_9GAMM|nr:hypothetical protein [Marinobacter salinisoli]QSP93306.1 hypothetical protein LPB19_08640 [Marinobacter salinisoli]
MQFQALLDSVPLSILFLMFVLSAMLISEAGYRVGHWWQRETPEEKEGPTNMIVGSLLGLLAFMLAVTMGMSSDRFDTRRAMTLAEANSIGTTYMRAGYLAEPAATQSRTLLSEYAPLRVVSKNPDPNDIIAGIARSQEIHTELWSIAEELARENPNSPLIALYIHSLNETIDLHETRVTAGIYARLPITVFILLLATFVLTLGMVGYSAGLTGRRSPPTAVVLIVVLGGVLSLLVDLDRPAQGLVIVNQQPLIDLLEQINTQTLSE